MHSRADRTTPLLVLSGVLVLGAAALAGAMAGESGTRPLLFLVALGAFGTMLVRPELGMWLLSAAIFLETALLVNDGVTAPKLLGVALFGAWAAHKLVTREPWMRVYRNNLFVVGTIFLALVVGSSLWAWVPAVSVRGFVQLAQLFAWALIITDLVSTWEKADHLARALLIGALLAAAVTVWQSLFAGMRRAGEDVAGGTNGTAAVLLTMIPFAFYFLRANAPRIWRVLGLVYLGCAPLAILLTLSRLNMLLLLPLMGVLCWHTLRSGRGRQWLVGFGAVAAIVALLVVPWDQILARAETISPYLTRSVGAPGVDVATSSSRAYHLRIGLEIARDHPLIGVGYNNYGYLFLEQYQFTTFGAPKLWHSVRSPHSSHVGILADLGLVGFGLWLVLVLGVGMGNALRAWRRVRGDPTSPRLAYVQAVTYALGLHVFAYAVYMPNQKEKIFWTLMALSLVVARLSREAAAANEGARSGRALEAPSAGAAA